MNSIESRREVSVPFSESIQSFGVKQAYKGGRDVDFLGSILATEDGTEIKMFGMTVRALNDHYRSLCKKRDNCQIAERVCR
jgi:hypothetical protein